MTKKKHLKPTFKAPNKLPCSFPPNSEGTPLLPQAYSFLIGLQEATNCSSGLKGPTCQVQYCNFLIKLFLRGHSFSVLVLTSKGYLKCGVEEAILVICKP